MSMLQRRMAAQGGAGVVKTIPEQKIDDIVCYVGMLILAGHLQEASLSELIKARSAFLASANGIEKSLQGWPAQNRALFREISTVESELR
jgi:hypothetical protein